MSYVQLLFKMPFSRLTFFLYFLLYAIFVGWKFYASLAPLIMNGHYCGHYTTNNIESKITEYWLVNEEGNFSYMTWRRRGQNFSIASRFA